MKKLSILLFFIFFTSLAEESTTDSFGTENVASTASNRNWWDEYVDDDLYEKELKRQSLEFDDDLIELLIEDCPARLKRLLSLDRNNFEDYFPQVTLLVGPPGVGKSSLAKAIAVKYKIKTIYIRCSLIANEYKSSGAQNLLRIFMPLIDLPAALPHIVILDEINILTDKLANASDLDRDMAVALWQIIDELKGTDHKLIATANVVDKLPAPLKDRFAHATFEIPLPSVDLRKNIIRFWLEEASYSYDEDVADFIAQNTQSFSPRMLKTIVALAAENTTIRTFQSEEYPEINKEDARTALIEMKKSSKLIGHESQKNYLEILKNYIPTALPHIFSTLSLVLSAYGIYRQELYYDRQLAWQLNIK